MITVLGGFPILCFWGFHQDPQGTSHKATLLDSHHCYHQINPHKVTAMASTLERLIVDY
jgi:hypothetical protein